MAINNKRISHEMKEQVARLARRHYSTRWDRVNWRLVCEALNMPLLSTLKCYEPQLAHIEPRQFPDTQEWPIEDVELLRAFTDTHFTHTMSVDDWILAAKYINIAQSDCIAKMWALSKFQMTPKLYTQISEYRTAGLLWPTIYRSVGMGGKNTTLDILRVTYTNTVKSGGARKQKRQKATFRISKHQHWNKQEDNHLLSLLKQFESGRDIDWNYISKETGHSKNACRYRRILLRQKEDQ